MKKIVRNLLVGMISFLPTEKVSAEPTRGSVLETKDREELILDGEDSKKHLRDILKNPLPERVVGADAVEDAMHFFDEMESQNITETLKEPQDNPPSNQVNIAQNTSTNVIAEGTPQSSFSVPQQVSDTNKQEVAQQNITNDFSKKMVEKPIATPALNNSSVAQKDLTDLMADLDKEKNIPSKKEQQPLSERKWGSWLKIGFFCLIAPAAWFLTDRLDHYSYKKWKRKQSKMNFSSNTEKTSPTEEKTIPSVTRTVVKTPKKTKPKQKKQVIPVVDTRTDEEKYLFGIRQLARIKQRRMVINRQMKTLTQEINRFHQSTARWADIANQISELEAERKKLTSEARQARTLIKGKQGELIKEERRLLAKEMRIAKTTNDLERYTKLMQKRLAIKQQERQILLEAQKKIKERQEMADRWHGIRLFQEVHEEEKSLKEHLKQLKKETGLKQKEILELEEDLNNQYKQIKAKKSLARIKVKGSSFIAKRRILSKKIIMAHNTYDLYVENHLKQELQDLKQAEREHIKQAENADYIAERRKKIKEIHPIIDEHIKLREAEEQKRKLQEQQRQAKVQYQKDRDERALFLQGQRMLRDLRNGLSETVNLNQMTPQDYKKWAYGKIGKNWVKGFNYEEERAAFLKPSVFRNIYLNKKRNGLIK